MKHAAGTRQEWLRARLELSKAAKELTLKSDQLAEQRQRVPWVRIEKDYRFETDEGAASLAHGFDGFAIHLAQHDVLGSIYRLRSASGPT